MGEEVIPGKISPSLRSFGLKILPWWLKLENKYLRFSGLPIEMLMIETE